MPTLRQAIAAGQYVFPHGLFFGGAGPSAIHKLLVQHGGSNNHTCETEAQRTFLSLRRQVADRIHDAIHGFRRANLQTDRIE